MTDTISVAPPLFKLIIMFGIIAFAAAYFIAKKLDDLGEYKPPKGKYRNRYK